MDGRGELIRVSVTVHGAPGVLCADGGTAAWTRSVAAARRYANRHQQGTVLLAKKWRSETFRFKEMLHFCNCAEQISVLQ